MDLSETTLQHLLSELSRLDLLIHRRMRQMARLDAMPIDEPAATDTMHLSELRVHRLIQQPFGMLLSKAADQAANEDASYDETLAQMEQQIAEMVQNGDENDDPSLLIHLASLFGLTRFDLDALIVCLAPALDLRYEEMYCFLNDDLTRRQPTVNLIIELLCPSGPQRLAFLQRFSADAPLIRHRLLETVPEPGGGQVVLLNRMVIVDAGLVAWLLGDYQPHSALRPFVELKLQPVENLNLLLPEYVTALDEIASDVPLVVMAGRDSLAQQLGAAWLASRFGAPLLSLNLTSAVKQQATNLEEIVKLFLRDALLCGAVALIVGWDAALEDNAPPAGLFRIVCEHPGPLVLCSETRWRPHQADRTRRLYWLDFPLPDYSQRRWLLDQLLQGAATEDQPDIAGLAGRFALTSGQLRDLVASAIDHAAQKDRQLCNDDLFAAAREHSSPRLAVLARKLTPRYGWNDLVLPPDQVDRLRELVDMVRGRPQVLDEWGIGQKLAASAGISALFAGPPGTGKTMGAEVIARVLGLDLYKIDLSSLVSKYIGETEKNLERIFSEAESSNAILFFDEADAIFGKRSEVKDAHDRYANIEVSYLLQRMEVYDGVTILATNLRANLDEAFTRRLNVVVDFPFPDVTQRIHIWQTLFPSTVPRSNDVDFGVLAKRFKLAGGNIRNIIISAAHMAAANGQSVSMTHLLHCARREMQKLGRLTDEKDFSL
jgi:hypothetical protein